MSDFLRAVYVPGAPGLDPVDRALSDQERGWRRAISAGRFAGEANDVLVELCSAARPALALKEASASGGRLRLPMLKPAAEDAVVFIKDAAAIEAINPDTKEPDVDTKKPDIKEPDTDSDAEEEGASSAAEAALDTGDSGAPRLPFVTSYTEFKRNMDVLTFGLVESTIRDLPLVVAGGSVLAGLQLWPSILPPAAATLPYILGGKTAHFAARNSKESESKDDGHENALAAAWNEPTSADKLALATDLADAEAEASGVAPSDPAILKSVVVPADPLPLKFARIYASETTRLCNCPTITHINYNYCDEHRLVRAGEQPMSARDEHVLGQHAFLADIFWDKWGRIANIGSVARKNRNLNLDDVTLVDPYVARLLPDCFPAAVAALCAGYVAVDAHEFFLSPRGAALSNFRDTDVDLFFVGADEAGALATIAECHKRITAEQMGKTYRPKVTVGADGWPVGG